MSIRKLAEEIQEELPDWKIEVQPAEEHTDCDAILAFPAFLVDGQVLATGLPRKDWLLERLKERR